MTSSHRLEAALVPLAALLLAGVAGLAAPVGQVTGVQDVTSEAVRARDDAAESAKAAAKEQEAALKERAARKRDLDAVARSGLDGPRLSDEEARRRREAYEAATRTLAEKTMAATDAQRELKGRERDLASLTPPPGTSTAPNASPPAAPPIHPLTRLNPRPMPTYAFVGELNKILQDTKGLPAPLAGDPAVAAEPIEIQLRKIQDKYHSGPGAIDAGVARYPKTVPPIKDAGPVKTVTGLAGTRWRDGGGKYYHEYYFAPGGSFTFETGGNDWVQEGTGSWSQSGKTVTIRWTEINSWAKKERGHTVTDAHEFRAELRGNLLEGTDTATMTSEAFAKVPRQVHTRSYQRTMNLGSQQ